MSAGRCGRWLAAGAILLVSAMAFAACGDSGGPGGAPSGGSPAQGGSGGAPGAFEASTCGTCVLDACADEVSECQATPECTDYLDCLLHCGLDELGNVDQACDAACVPASESSEALEGRVAVTSCRHDGPGANCMACQFTMAPDPDCEKTVQETPCLQCFADKCCETRDACFGGDNPDCEALFDCVAPCANVTYSEPCIADCYAEFPDQVQTLVSERECALIECANISTTCDASTYDACNACTYETCGESLGTLISTPDGYLTFICALDCAALEAGPECYVDCTDKYPDQKDEFLLWGECLGYHCESICVE